MFGEDVSVNVWFSWRHRFIILETLLGKIRKFTFSFQLQRFVNIRPKMWLDIHKNLLMICTVCRCTLYSVRHHILPGLGTAFYNVLSASFCCVLLCSFFEFLAWRLMRAKRMMRSFLKNVKERNILLQKT